MITCLYLPRMPHSDSTQAPQRLQLALYWPSSLFSIKTMATDAESKTASAAPQRADMQALSELNERSCGVGLWEVGSFRPDIHTWKWITKATGIEKSGADFRCIFVSLKDPSEYVIAHINMRSDNMQPLKKAEAKFKGNLKFRISKVALESSAKQEYIHTSIKLKIDLAKTKADPVMQQKEGENVQPTPSMSIKDCKGFQQSQRFDMTALMDAMSEVRPVNVTRQVISVTVIDDSGDDDKPGQLTFQFFMDLPLSEEDTATMDILRQAQESKVKPVFSFFALQGKKKDTGYVFEADSKKEFFLVKAVGSRAEHLKKVAESLQAIPEEMRDVLQQASHESRDYENEPGAQTLCKLLSDLAVPNDVQKLNEKPTLWQGNWVEVGWPVLKKDGDTLLRKDGSKLFFQTTLTDLSGQVANVWMNQNSALALSRLEDKEAFCDSYAAGNQLFPLMSTVKIVREVKSLQDTGDASQFADARQAKQLVSLVVVHATDQPWDEAPTKAALEMIPLLRDLKDDTSAIIPAGLHMVEKSPHYAFTVTKSTSDGSKIIIPCRKVLALVRSTKNSKPIPLGSGFKLITSDVEDLLSTEDPTGQAGQMKHTLSAICTLSNMPQYKLDPPRGGNQAALVIITGKTKDSFVLESVQPLSSEAAAQVKLSLLKLLHLAMHIHGRDRKRAVEWDEGFSPVDARKCSRVGRSPTDAPLPEL